MVRVSVVCTKCRTAPATEFLFHLTVVKPDQTTEQIPKSVVMCNQHWTDWAIYHLAVLLTKPITSRTVLLELLQFAEPPKFKESNGKNKT